jgi:hypothetical protein
MHVDVREPSISRIINAAYPGYKGRKCKLRVSDSHRVWDMWDGGSRDYTCFIELGTLRRLSSGDIPQEARQKQGNPFGLAITAEPLKIPEGVAVVIHSIFCGKDMGITIIANQANINPLLPQSNHDLTEDQKIVLCFTRGLKSSYGGVKNLRFVKANKRLGITEERWEAAKAECIDKGLLKKNGAITDEGRNAVENERFDR